MEDIAADDDLLSDMMLDSLEFEPKIATHKMNQAYRSPRYKTQDVIDIVRNRVVIECDVSAALDDLLKLDVIKKHLATKNHRQTQEFQLHAKRYLETYLPESGVEFALTIRYKRALEQSSEAQTSKAGQAEAQARADEEARQEAIKYPGNSTKGKSRILGENGIALGTSKADLCVVATKPFKAGDLIILCKGGVKDLTKSEDEALREEAAVDRERQKEQEYNGVLGQGRDFSVIRSARKGCSQLLLGPARFVNHDCNPNCEFHRLGHSQMVFKCLRNIGLNEEITTFYGENYFEWENSECMCRTCEERGKGFFSKKEPVKVEENLTKSEMDRQRRTSQRKPSNRSPPPTRTSPIPTSITFDRNGKSMTKTFEHDISQREFDENSTTHRGPKCTCLTCGTSFWAPEGWWVPDECRRCERHYRIFKADWPGRLPTEGGWSARAKLKRKELEKNETESKRRKLLSAPSPGVGSNSDTDTPVKLSPLRDIEEKEEIERRPKIKARKRKIIETDDGMDEDAIDASLQRDSPAGAFGRGGRNGVAAERTEEESDLTSVSDEGDVDIYLPSMTQRSTSISASSDVSSSNSSKTGGPKMLGKEAKTETLALYWGAPTGDRRKRRQSHNGLESLAKTAKKESLRSVSLRKEHRRTASEVSTSTALSKSSMSGLPSGPESVAQQKSEDLLELGSPVVLQEDVIQQSSPSGSSSLAPEIPIGDTSETTPTRFLVGLATKGPERTSVKNLAMAWSAGVEEGGRGSRRRQPRDVNQSAITPANPTPQKKVILFKEEHNEGDAIDSDRKPPFENKVENTIMTGTFDDVARHATQTPLPASNYSTGHTLIGSASPSVSVTESPVRHVSPLLGPVPAPFANRPGVIPGKPIRKNLRWGSGKVSNSRPLIGPGTSVTGSPMQAISTVVSESQAPNMIKRESSPRVVTQGSATNGHAENISIKETSNSQGFKERLHSPLARAALLASTFSSGQLQNVTGNGNNAIDNGTNHTMKQRPASPISLMGPPRSLHRSSNSPGAQNPHLIHSPVPKQESERDEDNLSNQEQSRQNGTDVLHSHSS